MTKHLEGHGWSECQQGQTSTSVCGGLSTCKKGTMPSRAIACSRRGAPVRLCRPAPQQEKKEPITITQGEGQESVPMTRFPFTESPNLQGTNEHFINKNEKNLGLSLICNLHLFLNKNCRKSYRNNSKNCKTYFKEMMDEDCILLSFNLKIQM